MLDTIDTIAWAAYPQPEWNQTDAIPCAIRALVNPPDEIAARKAYHAFLFAVGNNHAGTYFPVVLTTLPFLADILDHGSSLARLRTLDIFIDLLAAFEPEIGYENIPDLQGTIQPLAAMLFNSVFQIWNSRRHSFLVAHDAEAKKLAHELEETMTALQSESQ